MLVAVEVDELWHACLVIQSAVGVSCSVDVLRGHAAHGGANLAFVLLASGYALQRLGQ
jgi:hypothetical protein